MAHSIESWNSFIQSSLPGVGPLEEELILTLTVPIVAEQDLFRVGFDVKRPSARGFVAITTGRAEWSRRHMGPAAEHIWTLLDTVNAMVEPADRWHRGH